MSGRRERRRDVERLLDGLFRAGLVYKVAVGSVEMLGGGLYAGSPPGSLARWVRVLTREELAEEPKDYLANHARKWAAQVNPHLHLLIAGYLLIHGFIEAFLGVNLLRDRLWAYPWAALFLTAFTAYLIYVDCLRPSWMATLLCLTDIGTVCLLFWEGSRRFKTLVPFEWRRP